MKNFINADLINVILNFFEEYKCTYDIEIFYHCNSGSSGASFLGSLK